MHWYILIIFAFNITIIVRFCNIRWGEEEEEDEEINANAYDTV